MVQSPRHPDAAIQEQDLKILPSLLPGLISKELFQETALPSAAAITAGAVALMLEWQLYERKMPGIDVFQIKSLLILGAIRPDSMEYPNREWGYGQLNLYNTFEVMRQL